MILYLHISLRSIHLVWPTRLIYLQWERCFVVGNLAVPSPSDRRGWGTYCIVSTKDKTMGFIHIDWVYFVYIMSSCLKHYSVCHELNTIDACWIAVDWWSNSSRCKQELVYLSRMWCLYMWSLPWIRHNYALFYQLPNSNLFTHRMLSSREKPLVNTMAPGSIFHHILN